MSTDERFIKLVVDVLVHARCNCSVTKEGTPIKCILHQANDCLKLFIEDGLTGYNNLLLEQTDGFFSNEASEGEGWT